MQTPELAPVDPSVQKVCPPESPTRGSTGSEPAGMLMGSSCVHAESIGQLPMDNCSLAAQYLVRVVCVRTS